MTIKLFGELSNEDFLLNVNFILVVVNNNIISKNAVNTFSNLCEKYAKI